MATGLPAASTIGAARTNSPESTTITTEFPNLDHRLRIELAIIESKRTRVTVANEVEADEGVDPAIEQAMASQTCAMARGLFAMSSADCDRPHKQEGRHHAVPLVSLWAH